MSESGSSTGDGDRGKATKSADAFRTISEVSVELNVPQHVLRFWESKFAQVNPLKRGGGRRYYRPDDIRVLERIRDLLYVDGFTIKGVQRLLREHGIRAVLEGKPGASPKPPVTARDAADTTPPVSVARMNAPSRSAGQPAASGRERRAIQSAIAELTEIRKLLTTAVN